MDWMSGCLGVQVLYGVVWQCGHTRIQSEIIHIKKWFAR